MKDKHIIRLLEKYNAGNLTQDENAILESWYINQAANSNSEITEEDINRNLELIAKNLPLKEHSIAKGLWPRVAAAAAVFIFISIGAYFYLSYTDKPDIQHVNIPIKNDIAPGGNKATLTLADGSKISLTDSKDGQLAEQFGVKITKTVDGQLIYSISNAANSSKSLAFNTIETPVGGQYQINLPDGSKVWLNAASSLRYPVRFTGNERRVEITGEAYFEVAHNQAMPFKVINADQIVEVLGTQFNVMAYPDEKSIETTLLVGSVMVSNSRISKLLAPGQQSQVTSANIRIVKDVDLEEVIAWKNGYFKFNGSLESIMNKVARWYDVEIVYQFKPDKNLTFGGEISRAKNISAILKIMELTGNIHFKVEGRRVTVMQ